MTKDQLREALSAHVRQPTRNPLHSVVAIYLGNEEYFSVLDDRGSRGSIGYREPSGVTFDGVPVYHVAETNHMRIVSESKE